MPPLSKLNLFSCVQDLCVSSELDFHIVESLDYGFVGYDTL